MIRQEIEDGENANYLYGVCAMQGWRTEMVRSLLECKQACAVAATKATAATPKRVGAPQLSACGLAFGRLLSTRNTMVQEDAHAVALDLADRDDAALFAIYDGHGGKEVAKFAAVHMVRALLNCRLCRPSVHLFTAKRPRSRSAQCSGALHTRWLYLRHALHT